MADAKSQKPKRLATLSSLNGMSSTNGFIQVLVNSDCSHRRRRFVYSGVLSKRIKLGYGIPRTPSLYVLSSGISRDRLAAPVPRPISTLFVYVVYKPSDDVLLWKKNMLSWLINMTDTIKRTWCRYMVNWWFIHQSLCTDVLLVTSCSSIWDCYIFNQ